MSGREVVILGAGFSRAASWRMPLVTELGKDVLKLLRADGDRGANTWRRCSTSSSELSVMRSMPPRQGLRHGSPASQRTSHMCHSSRTSNEERCSPG